MSARFSWVFLLTILTIWSHSQAISQSIRYAEEDIALQNKFIEATQQKLLGHTEKALEQFIALLKEDRDNHVVAYELAKIYLGQKDFSNALNYCNRAIKRDENNFWYWTLKTQILEGNRQFAEAATAYQSLSKIKPEISLYMYKWAENLKFHGNVDAALDVYNNSEEKFGVQEESSRAKFDIYSQSGNIDLAIYELEKLSNAYPSNVRFMNNLAGFLQKNGQDKQASIVYHKILKIDPDHPNANLFMAGNLLDPNDDAAYLKSIQALISNDNIPVEHKLKEILPYLEKFIDLKDKDLGEALVFTTDLLHKTHPDDARAHAIYADILLHSGSTVEAIRVYRKTLNLDDTKLPVWEQLMYALSTESKFDELAETCEDALDIFPNQAICYYYLGMAQMHENILDHAKENLKEARFISLKNPRLKAMSEVMLAKVSIKEMDWHKAEEYLNSALESLPQSNIEVYELKGDILFQQADIEQAIILWEKSKEAGNTSAKLEQKILHKQFIE